jgi:predicted  nucleic acid-binding Zn-ribbon protein
MASRLDDIEYRLDAFTDVLICTRSEIMSKLRKLRKQGKRTMAAIDDLREAVNRAVTEMQEAADAIMNHAHENNDTELADMAARLRTGAEALDAASGSLGSGGGEPEEPADGA